MALPTADIDSAEALLCGSHDDPASGHAAVHFIDPGPRWIGSEALIGELYTESLSRDNPLRFGDAAPEPAGWTDSAVYAIRLGSSVRARARRAGLDRGAQLRFSKVVGLIFHRDGTGHMVIDLYRDEREFEGALDHERALDEQARARIAAETRERAALEVGAGQAVLGVPAPRDA